MNHNIQTETGVMVIAANPQTGQRLSSWVDRFFRKAECVGDPSAQVLTLPNGRPVAYLIDLRKLPEAFECSFFQMNPTAAKAGQPPTDLLWLNGKTLENDPNDG